MTRVLAGFLVTALAAPALAQENTTVRAARHAYDSLDYRRAITLARGAVGQPLAEADLAVAYETLAFSLGSIDSTQQAIDAFRSLILVDPDREPDPLVISPAITQLYAAALAQVLVIRRVRMDSATFVAGRGNVRVRFQLSRGARTDIRVIGTGVDVLADSGTFAGESNWFWSSVDPNGDPLPPGDYIMQLRAVAGREEFNALQRFTIRHSPVDTLAHLDALPGFEERPEMVRPPRNWMPFVVSALTAGAATGTVFAIQGSTAESTAPRELNAVNVLALATGVAVVLRRPDLQPVEANIAFNNLLRQQLLAENTNRARENEQRLRQVVVTIVPISGETP